MKRNKIIIGSRGSKLALIYAQRARNKILEISSELGIEDIVIKKNYNRWRFKSKRSFI